MQKQLDYRQWPNVLAIDAQIKAIEAKLEACDVERERIYLNFRCIFYGAAHSVCRTLLFRCRIGQ